MRLQWFPNAWEKKSGKSRIRERIEIFLNIQLLRLCRILWRSDETIFLSDANEIPLANVGRECSREIKRTKSQGTTGWDIWSTGICEKDWNLIILPNGKFSNQNSSQRMRCLKFFAIMIYNRINNLLSEEQVYC